VQDQSIPVGPESTLICAALCVRSDASRPYSEMAVSVACRDVSTMFGRQAPHVSHRIPDRHKVVTPPRRTCLRPPCSYYQAALTHVPEHMQRARAGAAGRPLHRTHRVSASSHAHCNAMAVKHRRAWLHRSSCAPSTAGAGVASAWQPLRGGADSPPPSPQALPPQPRQAAPAGAAGACGGAASDTSMASATPAASRARWAALSYASYTHHATSTQDAASSRPQALAVATSSAAASFTLPTTVQADGKRVVND